MKKSIMVLCALAAAIVASADDRRQSEFATPGSWTPVALGIVPCVELPSSDWSVIGLRIGLLASRHADVLFLSVSGLADLATGDVNGIEVGGLCNHIGSSSGAFQVAGLVNSVDRDFSGLQVAGVYNAVNGHAYGMSVAPYCRAKAMDGLQIGLFNKTDALGGVQIGVVNFAEDGSCGLQIGVVNVMKDGRYPVMPVFNLGF